jgi:hypothetical protein
VEDVFQTPLGVDGFPTTERKIAGIV